MHFEWTFFQSRGISRRDTPPKRAVAHLKLHVCIFQGFCTDLIFFIFGRVRTLWNWKNCRNSDFPFINCYQKVHSNPQILHLKKTFLIIKNNFLKKYMVWRSWRSSPWSESDVAAVFCMQLPYFRSFGGLRVCLSLRWELQSPFRR